jgi:hypothetical protein
MAACADFIGFGEAMRLALLAVCSGHPAQDIKNSYHKQFAPKHHFQTDGIYVYLYITKYIKSHKN